MSDFYFQPLKQYLKLIYNVPNLTVTRKKKTRKENNAINSNRPFPSFPRPQCIKPRLKCSAFDMELTFNSKANKTHFHKKGCALGLILKVRDFGTRKWAIVHGPY